MSHPIDVPEMHIGMYLAPSPLPEITDQDREAARRNPGGRVYYVDPAHPAGAPPTINHVMGWRHTDDRGELTGAEFRNPQYEPYPATAGVRFVVAFELILWRVVEGYCSLGDLVRGMAATEFLAEVEKDGTPLVQPDEHGVRVVNIHTARSRIWWESPRVEPVAGRQILESWSSDPTLMVRINRDAPVVRLPAHTLGFLWNEARHYAEATTEG